MRRHVSVPLALFASLVARSAMATTYFVSEAGDDGHDGKSEGAAWQSISKVNKAHLQPGDSVLFRSGDTFHGTIAPTTSGTAGHPIGYGAYGSGGKPILSGLVDMTGWTSAGNHLWQATLTTEDTTLNSLVISGMLQPIGRFPKASAKNGGYLSIASHSGDTSITDPNLPAGADFTGGEIVMRMAHWIIDRGPITADSGTTLTFDKFANASQYPLTDGWGYFIENHRATLTAPGDWCYDAGSKKVTLYSDDTPTGVQAPTLDNLVDISGQGFLEFTGLTFEGSNAAAVSLTKTSSITIQGCDFDLAGTSAIGAGNGGHNESDDNLVIDKNSIKRSVSDGIRIDSPDSQHITITNNVIDETGMIAGMPQGGHASSQAISVSVTSDVTIEGNTITDTGFNAIQWNGSSVTIKNNVIDGFCSVLDDGGAIYTWNGPGTPYSDNSVIGNIATNGIGAPYGTTNHETLANGIYLDNNTNHVDVVGNTVYHLANEGFHGNTPWSVTMKDNTFFDNVRGWCVVHWVNASGGHSITDLDVQDNIFVNKTQVQTSFQYADFGADVPEDSTVVARIMGMGTIDHNDYYSPNPLPFDYYYRQDVSDGYTFPGSNSLARWQGTSGLEAHSVLVPSYPLYHLNHTVGENLYPDGDFETKPNDVGNHGSGNNYQVTWDTSHKVDGTGSLAVSFSSGASDATLYAPIGKVSSSEKYVMRVTTVGTTELGVIQVALRQQNSPYHNVAPEQGQPFGVARVTHEFLIDGPTDETNTDWQIQIRAASGTTYLDDVAVYEADATVTNPDDEIRFEVNKTDAKRKISLDHTYVDVKGTAYCGTLDLAPFSSIVLFTSKVSCTPPSGSGGGGGGASGPVGSSGVGGASVGEGGGGGGASNGDHPGSGGCACRWSGSGDEGPVRLEALILAGAVLARRRRRRAG